MADPPSSPDSPARTTGDDTSATPPVRESVTGTPRWVKLSWIAALLVVLLLAAMMLLGGRHGPAMHTRADGGTAPSGLSAAVGSGADALAGGSTS